MTVTQQAECFMLKIIVFIVIRACTQFSSQVVFRPPVDWLVFFLLELLHCGNLVYSMDAGDGWKMEQMEQLLTC